MKVNMLCCDFGIYIFIFIIHFCSPPYLIAFETKERTLIDLA